MTTSDDAGAAPRLERRSRLGSVTRTLLVAPVTYLQLVTSHRPLKRCDDQVEHLRGVFDPETGVCFVVREDLLFS